MDIRVTELQAGCFEDLAHMRHSEFIKVRVWVRVYT